MSNHSAGETNDHVELLQVGDEVLLPPFEGGATGVVVEDWGPLGQGGHQMVGIEVGGDDGFGGTWSGRFDTRSAYVKRIDRATSASVGPPRPGDVGPAS